MAEKLMSLTLQVRSWLVGRWLLKTLQKILMSMTLPE
jgi:hypothetical protein